MKSLKIINLIFVSALLSACSGSGWDGMILRDTLTPGVHAETSKRTWDENGNPHVKEVQSEPAYLYDDEAAEAQQ